MNSIYNKFYCFAARLSGRREHIFVPFGFFFFFGLLFVFSEDETKMKNVRVKRAKRYRITTILRSYF